MKPLVVACIMAEALMVVLVATLLFSLDRSPSAERILLAVSIVSGLFGMGSLISAVMEEDGDADQARYCFLFQEVTLFLALFLLLWP